MTNPHGSQARGAWREIAWVLASNLIVLGLAIRHDWPASLLFWPYWIQSVAIGFFARRRMLALREFSTAGLRVYGRHLPDTDEEKRENAVFTFTVHYAFIHLVYMAILLAKVDLPDGEWRWVLLGGATFAFGLWLGQRRASARDDGRKPRLDALRRLPYLRVIPMHFTLVLLAGINGSWSGIVPLVIFTGMKTTFDVLMAVHGRRVEAQSSTIGTASNENGRPRAPVLSSRERD